jgi:uncharacterized protein (DUF362 family)
MVTSVVLEAGLRYPADSYFFSPDEAWPEYPLNHLSQSPNAVYAGVRHCLASAGLDAEHFGAKSWNPLGRYISPGNKVFVLCNFVQQKKRPGGNKAFFAKCTHASVVRAIIDYVLIALNGRGSVAFGNAPLQSTDWLKVTEQAGARRVQEFYDRYYHRRIPISLVDLRQHIMRRNLLGSVSTEFHQDSQEDCVEVDLGADSLLDQLYAGGSRPQFRVLDYDPRRIERCHQRGRHKYILNRRILESDVIVSVPKLKTHEKVGITCAIKGCVGAVAHKDCLAHHRYGSPRQGGDEYPDVLAPLNLISAIHEYAYASAPGTLQNVMHSIDHLSRKVVRRFTRALSGAWQGNDTCWRMAVDLARLIKYADKRGQLHPYSQRKHLVLTDGIIGGEGNGPMSARPVRLGYLSFSDDVLIADYVNALAMGFYPEKIRMLQQEDLVQNYPLRGGDPSELALTYNGCTVPIKTLRGGLGKRFKPPRGWAGLIRPDLTVH